MEQAELNVSLDPWHVRSGGGLWLFGLPRPLFPCISAGPIWASQGALVVKNPPAKVGDIKDKRVQSLGWEDPLEEGMATHSSILV